MGQLICGAPSYPDRPHHPVPNKSQSDLDKRPRHRQTLSNRNSSSASTKSYSNGAASPRTPKKVAFKTTGKPASPSKHSKRRTSHEITRRRQLSSDTEKSETFHYSNAIPTIREANVTTSSLRIQTRSASDHFNYVLSKTSNPSHTSNASPNTISRKSSPTLCPLVALFVATSFIALVYVWLPFSHDGQKRKVPL